MKKKQKKFFSFASSRFLLHLHPPSTLECVKMCALGLILKPIIINTLLKVIQNLYVFHHNKLSASTYVYTSLVDHHHHQRMKFMLKKRMKVIIKLSELFVTVLKSFTSKSLISRCVWELIGILPYMNVFTLWKIVMSFIISLSLSLALFLLRIFFRFSMDI